jgi:hypothetical protein
VAKTKTKTKKQVTHEIEKVDTYARVLQLVAIVSVIGIYVLSALSPNTEIPVWVPAGLLGVAIGLSPEHIAKIITDALKNIIGKK